MAKGISKVVSNVLDPFELVSGRGRLISAFNGKGRKVEDLLLQQQAQQQQAQKDSEAKAAAEKAAAEKAAADKKAADDLAAKQDEARRMAVNDYLMQEGGTISRRRYLVGAK